MEAHVYITDKSGKRFWNTSVTYGYHDGEVRNLERHLANIKAGKGPNTIDAETARVVVNGTLVIEEKEEISQADLDLLRDLYDPTPEQES